MLRLSELKLPLDHGEEALQEAVLKRLRIPPDRLLGQTLVKRSCLLYTSPSPRDKRQSRMPSSA